MKSYFKIPFLFLSLLCFSSFLPKQENPTTRSNNETALILQELIKKHNVKTIEVTFRKRLFKSVEPYTTWTFPGGNYIEVRARAYNLDNLKYFELEKYETRIEGKVNRLILKFDKIK